MMLKKGNEVLKESENDSNRQIRNGAILSYAGIILNIFVTLWFMPWMVDTIGSSNYAIYTLANSFVGLFLMDFGLSAATSKYVTQYRAEGRSDKIRWFLSCIFELYLVIDIIVLVILSALYFFLGYIYQGLTPVELELYRGVYIMVVVYSILSFPFVPLTGVLGAYERFTQIQWINIAQKFATVGLSMLGLWLITDVRIAVLVNIIIGFASILAKVYLTKQIMGLHLKPVKIRWTEIREIVGFSLWSTIISIASRFTFSIAPTMLGIVSNSKQITLFAPANALESYFYTIAAAINGFFLPKISRYVANEESERLTRLLIRVGRYQTMLMGLIFSCFCVVGKDFLQLWMGDEFVGASLCAIILFIPDLFTFSQQIASTVVLAENQIKRISIGHVFMAITSVGLMFVLCKPLGAFGVAISIAGAYFVQFIWNNYVYNKYLTLDMFLFYKECYLKLLFPIAAFTVLAVFLMKCLNLNDIFVDFVVKSIIMVMLYISLIIILMDKEEKRLLKDILLRFRRRKM